MNSKRENLESMLIDYIDGKLNEVDKQMIEKELVNNADSFRLYEQLKEVSHAMNNSKELNPSEKLKHNFDQFLKGEVETQVKTKTVFFQPTWYQMAAAVALLVVGGSIGYFISSQRQHNEELAALRNEIALTRQQMMDQLGNSQSPSQRMLGVKAAYESVEKNSPNDEIIRVLVARMNEDVNSNVRLAAIDALSKFREEEKVKTVLIQSLAVQKDPVVQIALIQLLVEVKDKDAVKSFQKIIDDETSLPAVKDEAHVGIFKLS